MEFYTPYKGGRPVRLCEETRQFAYDSLEHHRYGLDTMNTPSVSLDDIPGIDTMSDLERYTAAIRRITEQAPIRICKNEMISGAATLGDSVHHVVPALYKGNTLCMSVSHLTINFGKVLRIGINGIRKEVLASKKVHAGSEREAFLDSCLACLDAFTVWHGRYLNALRDKKGYEANYKNLCRVPMEPPTSFYEAVQSIWFTFAFTRLCGNWPGIGRIDAMLGDYLRHDLENGILTLDEAREILAHFFIKGCEWVHGLFRSSGDAQHYQNIVLAGLDADKNEVTNEVTYLVLDIIEELGISDFPTTVRINKNTDEKLINRVAEVIRCGGGILAIYNEDLILEALTSFGYAEKEALNFANDGCWEVQVPGKTYFSYIPFDSLAILHHVTLKDYTVTGISSFEELYEKYRADLANAVGDIFRYCADGYDFTDKAPAEWRKKPGTPCTVPSLFEDGCVENGLSYFEGGPVYHVLSPHIGGLPDTANSLFAIKKLVFDEKKLSFDAFMEILRNNWEGAEPLRQYVLTKYTYFGNDSDEVDSLAVRLLGDFAAACDAYDGKAPFRFPSGVSTFGRQIEWAPKRLASAHGYKASAILAGNLCPTPGTDKEGATAIIRSYCKADMHKHVTGAALDIRLLPQYVEGDDGIGAIAGLIRGFVSLGGFFMQPDVADVEVLKDAQLHPEDHQTLSVRVSGWNARFVTLNREWQDMIIGNMAHGTV